MRTLTILSLTIFLAVSAFAQQGLNLGSAAPEFSATGLSGQQYALSQLQGKIVVMTFWSTKCNICHSEIPKLNQLANRYKGQDVVFLAMTTENESKVENYLRSTPFDFNILPNSFGMLLQYADRDKSGNINMGFPAYFLVDQTGGIQLKTSGWDKTRNIDSKISSLLATAANNKLPNEMAARPK